VLAASTLAVYAQVVHHDFVNWDDPVYVTRNPVVSRGLSLEGVAWAFTHSHGATWHPITSLSHMLDCQLWGLWPGGHHLMSVLLHVAATLLLLGMLSALTGEPLDLVQQRGRRRRAVGDDQDAAEHAAGAHQNACGSCDHVLGRITM